MGGIQIAAQALCSSLSAHEINPKRPGGLRTREVADPKAVYTAPFSQAWPLPEEEVKHQIIRAHSKGDRHGEGWLVAGPNGHKAVGLGLREVPASVGSEQVRQVDQARGKVNLLLAWRMALR